MKTKICTKCKTAKPLNEFYQRKDCKNGLRSHCKKCRKKYYQSHKEQRAEYYQNHKEQIAEHKKKYQQTIVGHLRQVFSNMKKRCTNPKNSHYKNYGGRGIELRFVVDKFIDYVTNDLQVDPRGLQIDRIDNDGHYEPGNIRFVTCKENCNNRGRLSTQQKSYCL